MQAYIHMYAFPTSVPQENLVTVTTRWSVMCTLSIHILVSKYHFNTALKGTKALWRNSGLGQGKYKMSLCHIAMPVVRKHSKNDIPNDTRDNL